MYTLRYAYIELMINSIGEQHYQLGGHQRSTDHTHEEPSITSHTHYAWGVGPGPLRAMRKRDDEQEGSCRGEAHCGTPPHASADVTVTPPPRLHHPRHHCHTDVS